MTEGELYDQEISMMEEALTRRNALLRECMPHLLELKAQESIFVNSTRRADLNAVIAKIQLFIHIEDV